MRTSDAAPFSLFEAVPEAIIVTDELGRILFSNQRAARTFGVQQHALHGIPLLTLISERFRASHDDQRKRVVQSRAPEAAGPGECVCGLRADGREFPALISMHPLNNAGAVPYVVASVHELPSMPECDVRASQPALAARHKLDGIPDIALQLDQNGRIIAVNETWRRMAKASGADPATERGVGIDYLAVCLADRNDASALAIYEGLRDVVCGDAPFFEFIYRGQSLVRAFWFRLRAYRPEDGSGGAIVIHSDVTDYYMANARLNIQTGLSKAINARLPMLDASKVLAIKVCEELDWDYAGIWALDVRTWTLRCATTWTRPSLDLGTFEQLSLEASLGPGVGLPGRAWTTAKVQWVTDSDMGPNAPDGESAADRVMPPSALRQGFRAAMAFPLKYGDDVLAVVELFSRNRWPADEALMEQLESAGDQLALWELTQRAKECARIAERDADDARANLEAVLECAPAFVMAIDEHDAVQFLNREMPGQVRDDILGRSWHEAVASEDHARVERAMAQLRATGHADSYETMRRDPDGTMRWFTNYMGPMRSGRDIAGVVVISQDVTSAKQAHAELADAQRLAAVGTLAAGVAHEINTPVQFVSDSIHFLRDAAQDVFCLVDKLLAVQDGVLGSGGRDELVQRANLAAEAVEDTDLDYLKKHIPKAFERSIEGLERVATIVRSMKEFAHPAQKEMAPVDLNRAIGATLTVARNEYKYVANLETDFGELPHVTCHVNEINQVVLNIVVNAAHAIADIVKDTSEKGAIRVATRRDGPTAVISISDTGGGIPESIRHRIFDPFFTTKEVGRGTGQGLAIAWTAIRDKHRGELFFETELGKGTTFLIRIPIDGGRPSQERA
jgi:PAS domain S-box-containing protein